MVRERATRAHFADTWQTGSAVAGCTTQNHLTLVTVDDPTDRRTISIFETIKLPSVIGHSHSRAILSRLTNLNRRVRFNTWFPSEASCLVPRDVNNPIFYAIRDQWNRGKLSVKIGAWSVANYRQIITDINGLRRRVMRRRVIERRAVGSRRTDGSVWFHA